MDTASQEIYATGNNIVKETIQEGLDNYELTVTYNGTGTLILFNLGSSSSVHNIFYVSGSRISDTHTISLTKNGSPINFDFKSLAFDSLDDGNISVTNQNNAIIAANIEYSRSRFCSNIKSREYGRYL